MEAKPSGGIGHVTCKWNTIGENGSLVGHGGSDRVGRLRASSPVCDEIGLRYMSYSGSCVKGKRKGLHGFWVWNSSVTVQAMKMGRGLGQDVEDSGSCTKCQRGPEPSFSFPFFFFFHWKFLIYQMIGLKIRNAHSHILPYGVIEGGTGMQCRTVTHFLCSLQSLFYTVPEVFHHKHLCFFFSFLKLTT